MIKGSSPDFFPKVERADAQSPKRSAKKGSDASELLSSSSSSNDKSSSGAKQSSFNDTLKNVRSEGPERAERTEPKSEKQFDTYKSKSEVSDGSAPEDNKPHDKVVRRALDPNSKKNLEAKAKKNDDFVMPGMLPSKFSTPKRGLETELTENDMIPEMAGQDALMKQEAVSDFVEQMQNKFGISAEQIVAAFAQLNPQVLAAPVSESTQAFVNELPVEGDQKAQVAALYTKMLEKSGDQIFSEQMMGNNTTQVGTEVLGQKEYDQKVLDQSLREMNQQFFQNAKVEQNDSKGKVSVAGMTAASGTVALASPVDASAAAATTSASAMSSISSSGATENHLSPTAKKSSANGKAAAEASIIGGVTAAFSGGDNSTSSVKGGSEWSSQSQQQNPQQQQQQPQTPPQGMNIKAQAPVMAVGAFTPEIAKGKAAAMSAEGKEGKALKGDDLLSALNNVLGQGSTASKLGEGAAVGPAAMLPNAVQPNADEKSANIQQLVKQAQVIIKQGGGEMKLQMSPEGMGQVNLKVAVENGQVNIQMVAHNKETKKMIEEGLTELKASLAAHKLQVDNLKVDLSDGVSKQMQEQLADHQRNQAREFAQNFLSNMRDERQDFRQGFFQNGGYRTYKSAAEREGGVPQPKTTSVAEAKKKQTDRRLDMVA